MSKPDNIPYPGFPEAPCPLCGGSTVEPWLRYPACDLCNPWREPTLVINDNDTVSGTD